MIEFGIVGAKNSGKTTLVEKLIPLLVAKRMKVATVKHTGHQHTFDTEGKDSYRHRQSGAGLTMAIGKSEMALFALPQEEFQQAVWKIIAENFDICLVEGDKSSDRPKLFLTRNKEALKGQLPKGIVASYGAERLDYEIKHFNDDELGALADFILAGNFSSDKSWNQKEIEL